MVTTETYGGTCPRCGYKRILMRFGSHGWFIYDACPKCEFAYGGNGKEEFIGKEVWDAIIHADRKTLKKCGLPLSITGLLLFVESLPDPPDHESETVFDYDKVDLDKLMKKHDVWSVS